MVRPLFRRTATDPNCLGLVLHSNHAASSYRRAGIPDERLLVAHNGIDAPRLGEPLSQQAARSGLDLPEDRSIAVYAGRIGRDKGLDQLAAIADRRPEILFLVVGATGAKGEESLLPERENVRLIPWQDPAALGRWLWAADVLLVPPSRAPLERFGNCVLPIKIFTYLAAGRPILAPDAPDTSELLEHEQTALLVEPERPELAAAALDRLFGEPGLADRLGANGRRLAEGLSWDKRAERIAGFLQWRLAQRSLYSNTVMPVRANVTGAAQAPTAAGK
jgi:glycosyltransferase involved in cell wall biosynthesis